MATAGFFICLSASRKGSFPLNEVEEHGRVDNLDLLKDFEVRQVMVPRDNKVGFALSGAFQDAVVLLMSNDRESPFGVDRL